MGTEHQEAPLVQEEKLVFGVHAHAMSLMTIARIRNVYSKIDARSVARQLGMSHRENATPIRILHNSAAHLSGAARSFGAILMGYLGNICYDCFFSAIISAFYRFNYFMVNVELTNCAFLLHLLICCCPQA